MGEPVVPLVCQATVRCLDPNWLLKARGCSLKILRAGDLFPFHPVFPEGPGIVGDVRRYLQQSPKCRGL
jgi:hypothetical protein